MDMNQLQRLSTDGNCCTLWNPAQYSHLKAHCRTQHSTRLMKTEWTSHRKFPWGGWWLTFFLWIYWQSIMLIDISNTPRCRWSSGNSIRIKIFSICVYLCEQKVQICGLLSDKQRVHAEVNICPKNIWNGLPGILGYSETATQYFDFYRVLKLII